MNNLTFGGFGLNVLNFFDTTVSALVIFVIGLLVIAGMIYYYVRRRRFTSASIKYSDLRIVKRAARSNRQRYRFLLSVLRLLAISFLIVAFARPRSGTEVVDVNSEGIDIMALLDVSSSMLAEDFKPENRIQVAKQELKKFIQKRVSDRIGLIVFARYAFTQCPLTVDYGVLCNFVDKVDIGAVDDGTAIGMAITTAVNRLRESTAKSKIMVLLTDGDNNAGEIDPLTAANVAAAFNIKIYTIGVGKGGNAMFPVQDPIFGKRYVYQPTTVDETSLKEIASRTGGKYFRARSSEDLDEIYNTIDKLEKSEVKISSHIQYRELFHYFTYLGLLLLGLEIILSNTYFRKLP